jgi:mono/diheme cytochrome c family protein
MANHNKTLLAALIGLGVVLGSPLVGHADDAAVGVHAEIDADRLFTLKVLPLLKEKCFGCHGGDPEDIRGDYDLLSRAGMLKGGESEEPSVIPGKPEESSLYQAVMWEGYEMPPKENDRLTQEETEYIRKWIKAGAPWPDRETQLAITKAEWAVRENADGVIVDTSGGLSDDWTFRRYDPTAIWAFRPVDSIDIDKVKLANQHPVDFFIQRKLSEASLKSADQADPRILIRRASFDLIGLPPNPAEVNQFLAAWESDSQKAWEDLIDRLLASPHYGERWGQHWLDVTRYADTAGYSNDYERSNMWRYRDYVIRALNNDKPYDQFVVEQLAGDELWEQQSEGARNPELLVASSFLRIGPWDPAMVKTPEARQIYVDDVVNAVGQTFLATTMRCFKCHDHKFDPLPTRDYYRVYAAFAGTQLAERPALFLPEENVDGFEEGEAEVRRLLEFATSEKKKLVEKREAAARKWYREHDLPYKNRGRRPPTR